MRSTVNFLGFWSAFCALVVSGSALAEGPDARAAADGRWVPSLALTGGANIQEQKSSVDSTCATGGYGYQQLGIAPCLQLSEEFTRPPLPGGAGTPPEPTPPGPAALRKLEDDPNVPVDEADRTLDSVRSIFKGEETAVSPTFGINAQLLSPRIKYVPGRPRFFVMGELQLIFPPERAIAKEGDPGSIRIPELLQTSDQLPSIALLGLGSQTTSEVRTVSWLAGAGFAFPFELAGRRIWVKPMASYTRYEVDVEGKVVAGLKPDPVIGPPWGLSIRDVTLEGSGRGTFDAIGPAIEFDMEVGRFGFLGVSLFAGGGMYRVLGDRSVTFSDTLVAAESTPAVGVDPASGRTLDPDTYQANWSFKVDPWLYRANAGIRFHWLGN